MVNNKRDEVATQANKLRNGLSKIEDCRSKVQTMSLELEEAQVKIAEFQRQCDEYLIIIVAQKKQADEQQVFFKQTILLILKHNSRKKCPKKVLKLEKMKFSVKN